MNSATELGSSAHLALQPWYALRVRSKFERVTSIHLRDRGYEEFAPSYKAESTWTDRKKLVDRFLFPGYVFCRLDPNDRLLALTAPGVVSILGFGTTGPEPIPDAEINRVRRMVESGAVLMPWPFIEIGQLVLIERGPLAGLEGILDSSKGKDRVVVSITMLQRSVSTEIDRGWIRPIKSTNAKPAAHAARIPPQKEKLPLKS